MCWGGLGGKPEYAQKELSLSVSGPECTPTMRAAGILPDLAKAHRHYQSVEHRLMQRNFPWYGGPRGVVLPLQVDFKAP